MRPMRRLGRPARFDVCATAATAAQAVALALAHRPDLAVIDAELAGRSCGLSVATRLVREEGIPAVVCSGHPVEAEALETGAHLFLGKPFVAHEIQDALARALALSRIDLQAHAYGTA